jgi:salicylate hydroxylase
MSGLGKLEGLEDDAARPRVPDARIGIVGAGIGGIACAAFLGRAGFSDVTVYEQAPRLDEVGAGIQMAPNATRLLQRLGLDGRLAEDGIELQTGWELRRWQDGHCLFSQPLGADCRRRFGAPYYVLHRACLIDALHGRLPAGTIVYGQRCLGARDDGEGVTLTFADADPAGFDVVIGADGIHSVLRPLIVDELPPTFSGLVAYRCVVAADRAPERTRRPVFTSWLGPGRHIVHYPINQHGDVNVVAVAPAGGWRGESWAAEASVEELAHEFTGWEETTTTLLGGAHSAFRFALYDREPLTRFSAGRIGLLGDAAHPMLPFFAQGAGQAIEDAAVLAGALARRPNDAAGALRDYEAARLQRANRVQQLSRRSPERNHLPDGPEQRRRDDELATIDPLAHQAWIYGHDAERAAGHVADAVTGRSAVVT